MAVLLANLFSSDETKPQDDDKLLHLYWNRAGLKKEFAAMRKGRFKLLEKMKQQEGAAARLQQKLDYLEDLLSDPAAVSNAVVFYQLKGISKHCHKKLAGFAEHLKQQQEKRLQRSLQASFAEGQKKQRQALGNRIAERQTKIKRFEDQIAALQVRVEEMAGFWHFMKRRAITANQGLIQAQHAEERVKLDELLRRRGEIDSAKPPPGEGMDIETKRSINLKILAFAQQLYLHFADHGIAEKAKNTTGKSAGAVNFGSPAECKALTESIQRRSKSLDGGANFAEILKRRVELLEKKALFRKDADTIPVAGTVAAVIDFGPDGEVIEIAASMLGDDYWNIASILCC